MRHDGGKNNVQANLRTTMRSRLAWLVSLLAALCVLSLPATAGAIALELNVAPAGKAPIDTSPPTLSGSPLAGQTLTCAPGVWANNPTGFSYLWLRDGVPIVGQVANTYLVRAADRGHTIACRVTAANEGGNYTIIGLPTGSYNVSFYSGFFGEAGNYLFQYFSGQATASTATAVSVTAPTGPVAVSGSSATASINAELQAGGQISGVVTAAGSGPVSGVEVCATGSGPGGSFGCTSSNAGGAYTISSLSTGSYMVTFSPGESNLLSAAVNGVSVTAGAVSANVNAELAVGGLISGKVLSAAAKTPLANIEVCAEVKVSELFGNCAQTNSAGEYSIQALGTGSYQVAFFAVGEGQNFLTQYYNGKEKPAEATPVAVTAGATTANIDAELQAGGQISGRVLAASGKTPIEKIEVCANAVLSELGLVGSCAKTNAAGEYTIGNLPTATSYRVEFTPGFLGQLDYVQQYYNGKMSSAEATPVTVTAGAMTSNINAELLSGGHISGVVTDAITHAPLANVEACAFGIASGAFTFQCAPTNAAGQYTIVGLGTGTYKVGFSAPNEANYLFQYFNGKPVSTQADLVPVTAGATTGAIDAEMHVGGAISGRVTDAVTHAGVANVTVCAEERAENPIGYGCATTATGAGSVSATSSALTVARGFTLVKKPVFDAKTDDIDFFFNFSTPGKLAWSLFFRNADVGFADSLGISLDEGSALAQAAKSRHKGKARKCKKGEVKRHGKCKRVLIPFGSGSRSVAVPGTVEVKVHAGSKAIKALKSGRTLHVSGSFTFQPAIGGPAETLKVSATAKLPPKKHHKGKGKH